MNEQLLTISLLLMNASMLLIALLLMGLQREVYRAQGDSLIRLVLNRLSSAADRQRALKKFIYEDGKLTRQRIAQVKTRMADEERDDQREKAAARRKGVQS